MFENPRRGRQARNFATNAPKILDLKSSSEQIFSENLRWVPRISGKNLLQGRAPNQECTPGLVSLPREQSLPSTLTEIKLSISDYLEKG